jgi:hypothetical protein
MPAQSRKQAIEEMRHLKFRRGFEKGYDTGARNGTREGEKRGYKAGHRDGLEEGIEIGENRILDAVADYIPANVLEALRRKQVGISLTLAVQLRREILTDDDQKEYILVVYSRKRGWEEASQADDSDSDEEPQPQPAKKRARRYLTFSDDSTDESEAGEDNEEDSGKGQQSDESDEDEDTPAPAVQSEEQRRRDRTAIKPPSALEVRLDSENPLPAAPFQAPASNPSRRWTKAEILVIVYERRLGRFANRKPDGDFSWGRWISYVSTTTPLANTLQSPSVHILVILISSSSVIIFKFGSQITNVLWGHSA